MSSEKGYRAELVEIVISPEAVAWIKEEAERQLNMLLYNTGVAEPHWIGEHVSKSLNGPNDWRFSAVVNELRNVLRDIPPRNWFHRTDLDSHGEYIPHQVRMYGSRYVIDLVQVPLSVEAMRYMASLGREQLLLVEKNSGWTLDLRLLAKIMALLLRAESRQREHPLAQEILGALKGISHSQWFTCERREVRDGDG